MRTSSRKWQTQGLLPPHHTVCLIFSGVVAVVAVVVDGVVFGIPLAVSSKK